MTSPTESPRDRPAVAVAYAIAANGIGGLPIWMLAAFAPYIQQDLGFDDSGLGIAIGIYFMTSTLTGLPVGRLVQHWGWRTGIAFSSVVSALCLASMTTLAFTWAALVATLCIGALSNNSSQPAANLAIAATVPTGRQGLAFGLKQAALPISTVVVGLAVPLFDNGRQWREAFLAATALALVLVILVLFPQLTRALHGWHASRRKVNRQRPARAPRVRHPYKMPAALLLLAVGAGFGTAAVVSLGGFLVVFSVQAGFTASQGGALLAMGSMVGVVVRIVSGHLADRRGRRHLVVVAFMMGAGSLGFLIFAFLGSTAAGLIVGTVFTFGLGWSWNGLLHFSVIRYIAVPAAVATSVIQTAMSFGSAIGPILFGFVSEWTFTAAWGISGAFLALASAFVLLARRSLGRNRPPASSSS